MTNIKIRLIVFLSIILLSSAFFSGQAFAEKCASDLTPEELDQLYEG